MVDERLARILVPTDMSDFGASALRWAGLFHDRLGSRLTVLYATPPPFPVGMIEGAIGYAVEDSPELAARLERELEQYTAEHLEWCGSAVDTMVIEDTPAIAVLETARAMEADLIIMATHGRTGWRRALLGSVTENVIHHADRPVLTVPGGRQTPPAIRRIVCPVNFQAIGRLALEEASALAEQFHAELLVVHVAEHSEAITPHVEESFASWIEPGIRNRCSYSQVVARGHVADAVLMEAEDWGADLVVLGAQHRRFRGATIIGTTTERVARFSSIPVWIVQSYAEARKHEPATAQRDAIFA